MREKELEISLDKEVIDVDAFFKKEITFLNNELITREAHNNYSDTLLIGEKNYLFVVPH
jgi:hypothetical protein